MVKLINPANLKTKRIADLTEEDLSLTTSNSRLRFRFDVNIGRYTANQWLQLSDFRIKQGRRSYQPTSLAELRDAYTQNRLSLFYNNNLVDVKSTEYNLEVAPLHLADTYVSTNINPDNLGFDEYFGQRRLLNQKADDNGKFLYVCVNGAWGFYPKKDIGYYVSGEFKTLEEISVDDLASVAGRDLYLSQNYGNYPVTEMLNSFYSLSFAKQDGKVVMDSVSASGTNGLTQTRYFLNADGTDFIKANGKYYSETEELSRSFNEQSFRMIGDRGMMETTTYQAVGQYGDYIRINIRGQQHPIAVKVTGEDSQVYLVDSSGRPGQQVRYNAQEGLSAINNLVGKEVFVKVKDGSEERWMRSAQITSTQASVTYSTETRMHRTMLAEDRMAKNAYLRLANGEYVKESEFVRPVAYKFVKGDETNFDAYCCYVKNREGETVTIIVPKDVRPNTNYKGYTILPENMYKVRKSIEQLKDCDVIQTTNDINSSVQKCVTLSVPHETESALSVEKKSTSQEDLKRAIELFKTEYKQGKYTIDGNKIIVPIPSADGTTKNVELPLDVKSNGEPFRFVESDKVYTDDVTHDMDIYKYQRANPAFVDERTGKITKGPKYDTKAAIKGFYKKFGKIGLEVGAGFVIGGGPLIWLAAPILVAAVAAGYVATGIAAPFYFLAKGAYYKGKSFIDKVKANRNQTKKDLDKSMQELYEKVLSKSKDAKTELELVEKEAQTLQGNLEALMSSDEFLLNPEVMKLNRELQVIEKQLNPERQNELNAQLPTLQTEIDDASNNLQFLDENIYSTIFKKEGKKIVPKKSLTDEDLDKLTEFLGISKEDFKTKYIITGTKKLNKNAILADVKSKEKDLKASLEDKQKQLEATKREIKKYSQLEKGKSVIEQKILDIANASTNSKLNAARQKYAEQMADLKQFFENECNGDIRTYLDMLGETKYNASFEINNGVASVTEANAAIYSESSKQIKKAAKELREAEKQLAKHPDDPTYLKRKQEAESNLHGIINTAKSGKSYEQDSQRKEYEQKLQLLKNYLGITVFGDTSLDAALDEAVAKNYTLDIKSASLKLSAKTGLKKDEIAEREKQATKLLSNLSELYRAREDDKVVDYVVCLKVDDKYYSKKNGALVEVEIENVDGKDKIKSTKSVDDLAAQKIETRLALEGHKEMETIARYTKLDNGIYEQEAPVEEIISETPKEEEKPDEKKLSEEEIKEKAKQAEEKAKLKEELKKPILESPLQQDSLWKGIIYAREIAQAGINAPKKVNDFKVKLKHIMSKKYSDLLAKAAESAPLKIVVDGREQTIEIGLLSNTSEYITQIRNIKEQLKNKGTAKTK